MDFWNSGTREQCGQLELPSVQGTSLLFQAALRGDSGTVVHLLDEFSIAPDTRHPHTGVHLVLAICDLRTESEAMDARLAQVLQTLAAAGWSMNARRDVKRENALHLLFCQIGRRAFTVTQRAKVCVMMCVCLCSPDDTTYTNSGQLVSG